MDAEAAIRQLFAAFETRDAASARAVVHPECTFWPAGTSQALGRTGPYVGPDGVEEYFRDAALAWERLAVEPSDLRVAGAGVICFGAAVGVYAGTTEPVRIPVVWVFRMRDGLVHYARAVTSAAEAADLAG